MFGSATNRDGSRPLETLPVLRGGKEKRQEAGEGDEPSRERKHGFSSRPSRIDKQ